MKQKILMLVTTFGFHECLVLPQGIKPVTVIFQGRMISIFVSINKPPSVYLDDNWVTWNTIVEDYSMILNKIQKWLISLEYKSMQKKHMVFLFFLVFFEQIKLSSFEKDCFVHLSILHTLSYLVGESHHLSVSFHKNIAWHAKTLESITKHTK